VISAAVVFPEILVGLEPDIGEHRATRT
jgi:hypothetical protein